MSAHLMKIAHLYAGPLDGLDVSIKADAETARSKADVYIYSPEWSQHLNRCTFVHSSFKEPPPKNTIPA